MPFTRVDSLSNGELLNVADATGFDVLLTIDRNIRHQQTLTGRRIAVVILSKGRWTLIKARLATIVAAVAQAQPGCFIEVEIPSD